MNIDPAILQKYPKEKIDEAIALLTYQTAQVLPKSESGNYPILYVFRHGQTTDNADFIFSGWRDVDLTENGVTGAKILAEKIKDKEIHMLIASDQKRSIKTMQIAMMLNPYAKNLDIIQDPRIKERCYGDLQGTSKLLMALEDPERLQLERRSYDTIPPNGESLAMVVKRVQNFLDEIIPKMKEFKINVAVSCHGNSIRGIRQYFEKLSNEDTVKIETPLAKDYAAYEIK